MNIKVYKGITEDVYSISFQNKDKLNTFLKENNYTEDLTQMLSDGFFLVDDEKIIVKIDDKKMRFIVKIKLFYFLIFSIKASKFSRMCSRNSVTASVSFCVLCSIIFFTPLLFMLPYYNNTNIYTFLVTLVVTAMSVYIN